MTTQSERDLATDWSTSAGALLLVSLPIDLRSLAQWVAQSRQRALQEDVGYALHAAMKATLGNHAPKPFALLRRPLQDQVIGYTRSPESDLHRAVELGRTAEPFAAKALGIAGADGPVVKTMPQDWQSGERFSFEARVAPVVRSRRWGGGGYPEIDTAFHPEYCGDRPGDRDAAHAAWLARELGRDGAATLIEHRVMRFDLTEIARRYRDASSGVSQRQTRGGLLPDLTVRGQLRIENPPAFTALLARGLGRHRSFGFGCLLIAPAGAWT